MEITKETTVHKLDNIVKQKFNAYERNIDHSYTWNKFKIGTNIVLKKNPEYLNGPHNDKKMMEIVDNIWNEGLKLLPEAYQILIKFLKVNYVPANHISSLVNVGDTVEKSLNT